MVWLCVLMFAFATSIHLSQQTTIGLNISDFKMIPNSPCPNKTLSPTYRNRTVKAKTLLHCITQCGKDSSCLSIVYIPSNKTCHFGSARMGQNCINMVPATVGTFKYFQTIPVCLHGADPNMYGRCNCINSFVGPTCDKYMKDCAEGFDSGFFTTDGMYTIQPEHAPQPFNIRCQMLENNARNYIYVRETDVNFDGNRTWKEYKDGFGNLDFDYWLGLEKIYQLTTSKSYQLRTRFSFPNGTAYLNQFDVFRVNNETTGYSSYRLRSRKEDQGDCISNTAGSPFSTYDNDRDNSSINCAAEFGGGWWYNGDTCAPCNIMGPHNDTFYAGFERDVIPFPLVFYVVLQQD